MTREILKYAALTSLISILGSCAEASPSASAATNGNERVDEPGTLSPNETNVPQTLTEAIDHVWSGQRVWFDFVEQDNHQMIAYYDASRQMSVAVRKMRDVNGAPWSYHKVSSWLGWDAHNKVEAAFDRAGHIHLVGNLHGNRLVYFRSTAPYDPRTLVQIDRMVSTDVEERMTYPEFIKAPDGRLIFKYRDGSSGNGRWFYSQWDEGTGEWSHLHDTVLLSGEDVRGVYPLGPILGPDGYVHMTFTWRETPIASSNHDLSYARSADFVNWETSDGAPIELPIILSSGDVIDPIPEHGGLLNGRHPIGFDARNRVLVTYQKYDENNLTQVYIARREVDGWSVHKVSNWDDLYVDLDKSGALDLPLLNNDPAYLNADGDIVVPALLRNIRWEWVLDADDLSVKSGGPVKDFLPETITRYDLDNEIPQRVIPLIENQAKPSNEYFLSWEAMQPNRDQARPDIPPASTLRVHRITQK